MKGYHTVLMCGAAEHGGWMLGCETGVDEGLPCHTRWSRVVVRAVTVFQDGSSRAVPDPLLDVDSYSLGLAISFGRVDLLARLLDLLEDSGVVQRVFSCDDGGLGIERDVE